MKKLILDQLILLICGLCVTGAVFYMVFRAILLQFTITAIFLIVIFVMNIAGWGYLCRKILLLPLDLLFGGVEQEAYYARQSLMGFEIFKNGYYVEWRFWWHKGGVFLIVPMDATMEEIEKLETPPQNKKLLITYYRFSKIFIDYKIV